MVELYTGNSSDARHFRQNIRAYNSALSMTSQGANIDRAPPGGPSNFRINGVVSHRMGPVIPSPDYQPAFAQLYIIDPEQALQRRLQIMNGQNPNNSSPLREPVLALLTRMLEQNHPYIPRFRQFALPLARDFERAARLGLPPPGLPDMTLYLIGPTGEDDARRYNLQTDNSIAAFIPESVVLGPREGPAHNRDIRVYPTEGGLQYLDNLSPHLDPLRYPLLFPTGAPGHGLGMEYRQPPGMTDAQWAARVRKKLSMRSYAAFRIMTRDSDSSFFFHNGRLLQEWLVDIYGRVENERLCWYKTHQHELRTAQYRGLADAVDNGDHHLGTVGQRVILPSSFVGGPRYMQQACQDALAISAKFKKPDLFVTMTCNPNWPEIRMCLYGTQQPTDRPDLCARVFNLKRKALMHDLIKGEVLGRVVADLYVIEFQKRGLPHAHILIHFAAEDKPRTPEDIDSLISAQLPNEHSQPRLFAAVTKHMLHGPCGAGYNPVSPCMKDGACSKHFPKPFQPATVVGDDSYPTYARPDNGVTVTRRHPHGGPGATVQLGNQWVVPYNAALLLKYDCHINVEVCSSIKAIKYMHKYVYKGHDRAHAAFGVDGAPVPRDEPQEFQDGRFISASEAAYRCLKLDMHGMYPAVNRLAVHLPGEQHVTFLEGQEEAAVQQGPNETTLTGFFTLMATNPHLRHIKYPDIPQTHTWKDRVWTARKNNAQTIGRMYAVVPTAGERFFLRCLLLNVPGPTSFDDLKTVDGVLYPTFRAACIARGLTKSDEEWIRCIEEAVEFDVPSALRGLFSTLLIDCQLTSARALWERFEYDFCEDFLHQRRDLFQDPTLTLNDEDRFQALRHLQQLLASRDNTLDQHDLPVPPPPPNGGLHQHDDILRPHLLYDRDALATEVAALVPGLNHFQRQAWDTVTNALSNSLNTHDDVINHLATVGPAIPSNFFMVYSPGGCGKTHLNSLLLQHVRSQGHIALAMASSGIAALLMDGGATFHSRCKPPKQPKVDGNVVPCAIPFEKPIGKLFLQALLLLIDEVSMLHKDLLESLDYALRDLMRNVHPALANVPFGGKVIICTGDVRQILPVVKNDNQTATVRASLCLSYLWRHKQLLQLDENMRIQAARLAGQPDHQLEWFAKFLLDIGEGRPPAPPEPLHTPHATPPPPSRHKHLFIPDFMLPPPDLANDPKRLIHHIYGSFDDPANRDHNHLIERAILAPTNKDVDALNDDAVASFPGEEHVYSSADEVADSAHAQAYPAEYLHSCNPPGFAPHQLRLKVGIPIILLRNISPAQGLANGTRLVITHLSRSIIQARILTGSHVGNVVLIPRINMDTDPDDKRVPIQIRRRQFPVRPAFAMTINKSQGQTFKKIALYLPSPVFAHGQLYVALSRVGNPNNITIMVTHPSIDGQPPFISTPNVVYTEIFRYVNAPLPQHQHPHQQQIIQL